jgi:hypothetical protein
MYSRPSRAQRAVPAVLGGAALLSVAVLFVRDVLPARFDAHAHELLGAVPLALVALAYLLYQGAHRPAPREWVKALILAVAFLFWAANQLRPDMRQAGLFNDIAIALFVLDVFLVMIGWPAASPDGAFAEASTGPDSERVREDRIGLELPVTIASRPSINSQPRQDWREGDLVASSVIGRQKLAYLLLVALSCVAVVRLGKTEPES